MIIHPEQNVPTYFFGAGWRLARVRIPPVIFCFFSNFSFHPTSFRTCCSNTYSVASYHNVIIHSCSLQKEGAHIGKAQGTGTSRAFYAIPRWDGLDSWVIESLSCLSAGHGDDIHNPSKRRTKTAPINAKSNRLASPSSYPPASVLILGYLPKPSEPRPPLTAARWP